MRMRSNSLSQIEEPVIEFTLDRVNYRLTRLDLDEFLRLNKRALHISDDYGFYLSLHRMLRAQDKDLNFAQVYAALTMLAGQSSKWVDDWKGSFAFLFLVHLQREDGRRFEYLLNIYNHRDALYYGLRKILPDGEMNFDMRLLYKPFEEEFSCLEINGFIAWLHGYLIGFFRSSKKYWTQPFFHRVDSNLILFGYKDGEFFERRCESEEEYDELLVHLQRTVK